MPDVHAIFVADYVAMLAISNFRCDEDINSPESAFYTNLAKLVVSSLQDIFSGLPGPQSYEVMSMTWGALFPSPVLYSIQLLWWPNSLYFPLFNWWRKSNSSWILCSNDYWLNNCMKFKVYRQYNWQKFCPSVCVAQNEKLWPKVLSERPSMAYVRTWKIVGESNILSYPITCSCMSNGQSEYVSVAAMLTTSATHTFLELDDIFKMAIANSELGVFTLESSASFLTRKGERQC